MRIPSSSSLASLLHSLLLSTCIATFALSNPKPSLAKPCQNVRRPQTMHPLIISSYQTRKEKLCVRRPPYLNLHLTLPPPLVLLNKPPRWLAKDL